jgi:hypothetical protein
MPTIIEMVEDDKFFLVPYVKVKTDFIIYSLLKTEGEILLHK